MRRGFDLGLVREACDREQRWPRGAERRRDDSQRRHATQPSVSFGNIRWRMRAAKLGNIYSWMIFESGLVTLPLDQGSSELNNLMTMTSSLFNSRR